MAPTSNPIYPHKAAFLDVCLHSGVLTFGTFKLKSGRVSSYFFNAGLFFRADLLRAISAAYAETLLTATLPSGVPLDFDVLFGPAYKGIPLATATVEKLASFDERRFGQLCYSFNRKEAKDHGEGGSIVGAPLKGKRCVILDDVITAGTAIREAIEIIKREGGELVGIVVALDRMEKMPAADGGGDDDGTPRPSAIGYIRKDYGVPVIAILTLDDVIDGLKKSGTAEDVERLEDYRRRYGASD